MALEIVDVGFGRTGTLSLKLALEQLGFGPCHHMEEVLHNPSTAAIWTAAAEGAPLDCEAVFKGYRSSTDWPTTRFWREVVDYYPDAKIILTTRDPERWYQSISATIHKVLEGRDKIPSPDKREVMAMAHRIITDQTFDHRLGDAAHATEVFRQHNAAVIEAVPADRLLVFDVAEGWEPLCDHLNCPVPETSFPRVNSTQEFWELVEKAGSA